MSKRNRNILILIGGLALLIVIAAVGGRSHRSSSITVRQVTVRYAAFQTKLPENGVLQRPRVQSIPAQVSGNIGNVFVHPGQVVSVGTLLATIDNPQVTSGAQGAAQAYQAAIAHAHGSEANSSSAIAQAEASLESARARLTQAQQDLANGSQSGLGYGGNTATDQKAQADANLANADTNLREARRIYNADADLLANKAIARDMLDQAKAKLDQAQVAYNQARLARQSLGTQLSRSQSVLQDNMRSAQENYAQAQAALSAARVQAGGGDVAAAYADAAKAQTDYAYAADQAARTEIRAPFSGTILSLAAETQDPLRPLQPGDDIEAGKTLLTMSTNEGFIVRTKVDEQDIINVRIGQRASVTGEDFPGKTLTGHVIMISPVAQKSEDASSTARQIITTVRLDASPPYLRDGMSVDVDVLTTDIPHAIVVANDAVVKDKGKAYVFVVRKGIAHKQPVTLGASNDAKAIVRGGLHPGDVVVNEKNLDLTEGASVTAATPSPSPTAS